ncbi:hypothetical protein MFRU_020g01120 [Monilinia fructicola]|nr:hypothetical protein MFRU_020g01120 [Monilinia fructicola]
MSSSSPTSSTTYSPSLPTDNVNVTTESYYLGNTMLCQSAVSTYISAINSWRTFTPATCSYNNSLTSYHNLSSTLTIITPTAVVATTPLDGTPLITDVSTVTEFSSTRITTTVTGSLSTSSQASHAPQGVLGYGISSVAGLFWILYFSSQLLLHG